MNQFFQNLIGYMLITGVFVFVLILIAGILTYTVSFIAFISPFIAFIAVIMLTLTGITFISMKALEFLDKKNRDKT